MSSQRVGHDWATFIYLLTSALGKQSSKDEGKAMVKACPDLWILIFKSDFMHEEYNRPPLIGDFTLGGFQLPKVNHSLKILNRKFEKQTIHKF